MNRTGLDVAFVVQGEGRGHMTQALAMKDFLVDAGHRVVAAYLGTSPHHPSPDYFARRLGVPVKTYPSPTLVQDRNHRGMSVPRTAVYNTLRFPGFVGAWLTLWRDLRRVRPDVVVNFFEHVAGFVHLASVYPVRPPRVAVAHSYLLGHPGAAPPPAGSGGRLGLRFLGRVAALGAGVPVGLSFDPLPDTPSVRVAPPLLRPGLDGLATGDDGYLLAYALNRGYARLVGDWQARNRQVEVHCYVPGGPGQDVPHRRGFHVHALDDVAFLRHLARCRAYVGTAGFEAVCEAHYLGKPVLAVPVERHYEQAFNAADMMRTGVASVGGFGDLDSFWGRLPVPDARRVRAFRSWVGTARDRMVGIVEDAARRQRR